METEGIRTDPTTNYIVLVPVPVAGFDTKKAADAIVAATDRLQQDLDKDNYKIGPTKLQGVVVNMSFAVVPCKSNNVTAQKYITEIETLTDVTVLRSAIKKLYQPDLDKGQPLYPPFQDVVRSPDERDPLHCLMRSPRPSGCTPSDKWTSRQFPVVFVAAAGNSGTKDSPVDFPFAPALWPEVLSVSVSAATDPLDVTSRGARTRPPTRTQEKSWSAV